MKEETKEMILAVVGSLTLIGFIAAVVCGVLAATIGIPTYAIIEIIKALKS